jgi:hypothetical protein
MPTKQGRSASEKQARARVRKLEAKLERAEAKATRWKAEAKRAQAQVATLTARTAKLDKKLAKVGDTASRPTPKRYQEPVAPPASPATEGAVPSHQSLTTADASWTVAQLRAEARARGLTGLSNKPKAELLAALG